MGAGDAEVLPLEKAVSDGFNAVEWALNDKDLHNEHRQQHNLDRLAAHGVKVAALTSCQYDIFDLASGQKNAITHFEEMIKFSAEHNHRAMVIIPAHVNEPVGQPLRDCYEDIFNRLYDYLEQLKVQAEKESVMLTLENPGSGLAVSPLELRELVDNLQSAWAGICLNCEYTVGLGQPKHWLTMLGDRVRALRIGSQDEDELLETYKYITEGLVIHDRVW